MTNTKNFTEMTASRLVVGERHRLDRSTPDGAFNLADFVPGDTNRPVLPKDAARLGCRLEDFGRHWTEEPGHPWDRAKIVDALKNRAWDLACRQCAPGNA